FQYAGEIHEGVHEPIISKDLFDRVQEVLTRRWKWSPGKHTKIPKPFIGLLQCAECGGAITAEVQKGHTYYRCTKKNLIRKRCNQPYIREESLDSQLSALLFPYALRKDWSNDMLARLDAEEKQASNDSAALIAYKQEQVEHLQLKIGRLIEMRL